MKMAALPAILLLCLHLYSEVLSMATPSAHDFSYMQFVFNATELSSSEEFDYIVVGGGTLGCPLAATLSANYSVLLLERGGAPQANPNVLDVNGLLINLMEEDDGSTPAEKFTTEDGVANARGRVLGGSSMINVGFYSRADEDFYQDSGIEWDMSLVEKAYQWVEDTIVFHSDTIAWQAAVKDALLEANVLPDNGFSLKHKLGTKISGSTFDVLGRRHGAVELLNKAEPRNLRVAVHATVERIIFSSTETSSNFFFSSYCDIQTSFIDAYVPCCTTGLSAIGVIYKDSNGKSHRAIVRNKGEVILSAGTIGSPQLLLLSGVGPLSYLSSLHIPVVHNQPYVGQYIADNPRNNINIVPPFPLEPSYVQVVGIERDFYIESQSYTMPFYLPPPFGFFPDPSPPLDLNVVTIFEKLSRPLSKGSLRLASSTDVRVSPIVKFNYFAHPIDLVHCVTATRKISELLKTQSMDRFKSQNLQSERDFKFFGSSLPVNQSDDASMETFCREKMTTTWHYHGGCIVGKVVDASLRVIGIKALRIADASTFTNTPGTNPQATLMMLGRYLGLKILQERMEE